MNENEDFIESIEIDQILDCIADPTKIRVVAKTNREPKEVLPYICAEIANSMYKRGDESSEGFLGFSKGPKRITIYDSGKIAITKVDNEEEARILVEELKNRMNETYRRRDQIDINKIDKKVALHLGPLDVYQYLPKTNCGKCGEQGCMPYAIKLLNEEQKFSNCNTLDMPKYKGLKETLEEMLKLSGYEV
jgi:ArsR family metal-binding transcriptional regulator